MVDQLPPGQCAKGCTSDKLQNSVCDPECNVQACGYDNNRCNSTPPPTNEPQIPLPSPPNPLVTLTQPSPVYIIPRYSDLLQVGKIPFPTSIASVLSVTLISLSKLIFPGVSITTSLVGVTSVLSTSSTLSLSALVLSTDDIHGQRELFPASNSHITGVFSALMVVLTVHYVINALLVYVYLVWVVQRDAVHSAWRKLHPVSARVFPVVAFLFSFKVLRLMSSNLLQRDYFSAGYLKKARLSQPMLQCVYISLVAVNIPIIAICVYILCVYSPGNLAFMMSLDCIIVNSEDFLLSLLLIFILRRELTSERSKFELPKGNMETQDTAIADLEQVHIDILSPAIAPTRTPSEGNKYFDSDRDVYEAGNGDKRLEITFAHADPTLPIEEVRRPDEEEDEEVQWENSV